PGPGTLRRRPLGRTGILLPPGCGPHSPYLRVWGGARLPHLPAPPGRPGAAALGLAGGTLFSVMIFHAQTASAGSIGVPPVWEIGSLAHTGQRPMLPNLGVPPHRKLVPLDSPPPLHLPHFFLKT